MDSPPSSPYLIIDDDDELGANDESVSDLDRNHNQEHNRLPSPPLDYTRQWKTAFNICTKHRLAAYKKLFRRRQLLPPIVKIDLGAWIKLLNLGPEIDSPGKMDSFQRFIMRVLCDFARHKNKLESTETMWFYAIRRLKEYSEENHQQKQQQLDVPVPQLIEAESSVKTISKKRKSIKTRRKPPKNKSPSSKRGNKDFFTLPPCLAINGSKNLIVMNCTTNEVLLSNMKFVDQHIVKIAVNPRTIAESTMTVLTMKQLLNWPGLSIRLKLNDVLICRGIYPNYNLDLVVGSDVQVDISPDAQCIRLRRIFDRFSKHCIVLSGLTIKTYMRLFIRIRHLMGNKANEIVDIIGTLLDDLEPLYDVLLKAQYSKFIAPHPFVRAFVNPDDKSGRSTPVYVRQTMNPEIRFAVEQCPFVRDVEEPAWMAKLSELFASVFVTNDVDVLDAQKAMLRTCVSFQCLECEWSARGVLSVYEAMQHVVTHTNREQWMCAACGVAGHTEDWTTRFWKHKCTKARA